MKTSSRIKIEKAYRRLINIISKEMNEVIHSELSIDQKKNRILIVIKDHKREDILGIIKEKNKKRIIEEKDLIKTDKKLIKSYKELEDTFNKLRDIKL